MPDDTFIISPILKYPGGKSLLVDELSQNLPKFNNYYEPFCGSCAFGLYLFQNGLATQNLFLSDSFLNLINLYQKVKFDVEGLIAILSEIKGKYNALNDDFQYRLYYEIRNQYNQNKHEYLLYFLNKVCFNGLIRHNNKGMFNSAYGARDFVLEEDKLKNFSKFLNNNRVFINCKSFTEIQPSSGDLVYLDPPYHPVTETSNFNKYFGNWNKDNEYILKDFCDNLTQNGVFWILSNNNVEFIRNLFSEYNLRIILALKRLGGSKKSIGKTEELIITNF